MVLLVCSLFLIFGTWPLYGAAGALPQAVVWTVVFSIACQWFMRRPRGVLLLSLIPLLVWGGVVLVWK